MEREAPGAAGRRLLPGAGVAHARNVGVAAAEGRLVLICDSDDVATPPWIRLMVAASRPGAVVVGGANFGVDRAVWEAIDGWDERLLFAEDIDFSWRAQLAGHDLLTAPGAVVHYRLRPTMRGITRQALNWGRGEAELYAAHRANGFHRRRLRHVARAYGSIARRAPRALVSRPERGRWCRDLAWRVGRLSGSARQRVWFP